MRALIIGATGATGKELVNTLLDHQGYSKVIIFVRRPTGLSHPKLSEVLTDFTKLDEISGFIKGDVWFCCIGTTLKAAGSKNKQREIDYDIPVRFAIIARRNNVNKAVLLSAYGASPSSLVFYSRIKGELEKAIGALEFETLVIFRPGLLLRPHTDRSGERLSAKALKVLNAMGLLKRFRPLPTKVLAEKMAKSAQDLGHGQHIIELDKISAF